MALILFPECGQKISSKSSVCIHCGCPIRKEEIIIFNKTIDKNMWDSLISSINDIGFPDENSNFYQEELELVNQIASPLKQQIQSLFECEEYVTEMIFFYINNLDEVDDISFHHIEQILSKNQHTQENVVKCPTCGSTNVRHISATERGANALMFGLLGTKRKCQFECLNPNCKYRW